MQNIKMPQIEQLLASARSITMGRLVLRHPKYKYWGPALEHSGLLLGNRDKGKMLEADYLAMREIDDIADGDIPIPEGYNSASQYIDEKIAFLQTSVAPRDNVEALLFYCEQLSQKIGLSLTHERELILRSMLFDAKRFGKYQIFPAAVLNEHFYRCDIQGTGMGALKIFGEDPTMYKFVVPLGIASRIHDNLSDFEKDVRAGCINIPQEDYDRLGMTLEDIRDVNSLKVRVWFAEQVEKARILLEKDRVLFPQGGFSPLGSLFVHLYIRRPAVRYFRNLSLS